MKGILPRAALIALLAALFALSPALAAPAQTDILDINHIDGESEKEQPALEQRLPAETQENQDVPVDESTYREQPSASPQPPRLADGQPGRGKTEDLAAYWEQTGYPADVSYAFEAGGEVKEDGTVYHYWEIGLVGADEARRQQILDLASPQCLITFYSCTFSHSQKTQAYQALLSLAEQDENIRQVIFTQNTQSVVVGVPEGLEKDYARLLIHQMGLGAVVSVTDERYIMTELATEGTLQANIDGGAQAETRGKESALAALPGLTLGMEGLRRGLSGENPQPADRQSPFPLVLGLALALALTLALWRRKSRARLLQTTQGTKTRSLPPTRRQTARLIQAATHSPPPRLLERLLENLPEKQEK